MDKFVFTPTQQDLLNAYKLHYLASAKKKIILIGGFGLLVGIALAAVDGFQSPEKTFVYIVTMVLWAGIVGLIASFLIRIWWIPHHTRKTFKQHRELLLETETWWDDQKLYSSNAQSQATLIFSDLVKWSASDKVILLYRTDHLFNFLPARVFRGQGEIAALKRRLENANVPESRSR